MLGPGLPVSRASAGAQSLVLCLQAEHVGLDEDVDWLLPGD